MSCATTGEDKKRLASADNHDIIDNIRKNNIAIKKRILAYSMGKNGDRTDWLAADVRFAMEVFENDRTTKTARVRSDEETSSSYKRGGDIRNLEGIRDGLQSRGSTGVSRFEFASSGFRLSDNLKAIPANDHYVNQLEKFEANYENEYGKKHYSVNRSDNQGGFSNANTDEAIQQQEQGILSRAVDVLTRKFGIRKNENGRIHVSSNRANPNAMGLRDKYKISGWLTLTPFFYS